MISTQAKILNAVFRLIQIKRFLKFENPARNKKDIVPGKIKKLFSVSSIKIQGKSAATIEPLQNASDIHIIYLHGGAYASEGNSLHWSLIKKIIQAGSYKITYIDYPLSPEYKYRNTFEMVQESYDYITGKYPEDKFILMGDSAGGGLALAFTQKLKKEKAKIMPQKIVLFSPWLDLSMSNESIKNFEKSDMILAVSSLKNAAEQYSGGDDVNQYLLSPINGNLKGMPPTAVFFGTDELFYPDCIKLKSLAEKAGSSFRFFEYEKMQHDWILFPIPEAHRAIDEACRFIR